MGKEKLQQTGVIAASAGNHALALAYHGKDLGVPVTVVMPTVAPLAKVDKCRVSTRSVIFETRANALLPNQGIVCSIEIWRKDYH
jgi:threonine dehydratase